MSNQTSLVNTRAQLQSFLGSNVNNTSTAAHEVSTGKAPTVRDFNQGRVNDLSEGKRMVLISRIDDALKFVSSDERKIWVNIGYALSLFGNDGYCLWIEWSKKSALFDQKDADITWRSLQNGEINYPYIFRLAEKNGWVDPWEKNSISNATAKSVNSNQPKVEPDFSWTAAYMLSNKEADEISDPKWIYLNLIILGHLIAIPAPPNGGKTTILFEISCQLSESGSKVIYVNADISASDAKSMIKTASERGVTLLLPEMKAGLSMADVVDRFEQMNKQNADYSGYVVIFDTYKKMTDVISKSQSKKVLQTLRGLTAKGMTVILLSHTNKYKDADDNHIFEGTGDLRADVDELIYLEPLKHPDGSMTVSTRPDKVRGDFAPITFEISKDRKVTRSSDYIDVGVAIAFQKDIEHDDEVINLITQKLNSATNVKRAELVEWVKSRSDTGRDATIRVLDRWDGHKWVSTKDKANRNTITYTMKTIPAAPKPPQPLPGCDC